MKRTILLAAILVLAGTLGLWAQQPPEPPPPGQQFMYMSQQRGGAPGGVVSERTLVVSAGPNTAWIGTEFFAEGRPVKGAPYSAEAFTETVQTLVDGNRIAHSSSTKIYRDSEGRTRREAGSGVQTLSPLLAAARVPVHDQIFISDPVAGISYVLDPEEKTARKMPVPQFLDQAAIEKARTAGGPVTISEGNTKMVIQVRETEHALQRQTTTESLGSQTIEGVEAEGKRTTTTIPAGQIGNDLPIVITSEAWYSPQLQTLVLSRRHDPRVGDTTYRLINVNLAEPAASLFQVPADYTLVDVKGMAEEKLRMMRPDK